MKRKGLVALTLALSIAIVPGFGETSAKTAELDSQGSEVTIGHELPKAKTKGKEKFDRPAEVESSSVADVLDEKGKKIGEKKIKKNADKKADKLADKQNKKNAKKQVNEEGELCILLCGNGGSTGGSGGTTTPTATDASVVTVLIAADEEYRAAHSDWQTLTQNIVENADNGFTRDHNIDFEIKALGEWTSEGANASEILQDMDKDWNGNGYDFVVGFTRDANFNSGGIAYVYPNSPYGSAVSVNLDQGATNTWHAAQHEFSHNYGLSHDAQGSGIKCIMNYDYSYSVDYWDEDHDNLIEAHKGWYGN
ncbi:zinc-dependent metalloprotease [Alkalihalobacillus hwajinpoensis]|uniref:zinc-dependent metalloprotease n=1 Tax=Guptibacillus hwajinpoensis TaxID=208199 RepID=UPI001883BF07|nr:zinc-dependent metalloprotease [Pseudalkalibacillus hwajinpoensis]MBF0707562.1 zinc-dependent metalloprotease [Pseudalkalibacillus hwajinpoensis]